MMNAPLLLVAVVALILVVLVAALLGFVLVTIAELFGGC